MTRTVDDADPLPLSALQHWAYCPRQCGLIHLEQAFDDNLYTRRGQAVHAQVDRPGAEVRQGLRVERALYYASSKRRRVVAITVELRRLVERVAAEVRAMLAAGRLPEVTSDPRRCNGCSLRDRCQPGARLTREAIIQKAKELAQAEPLDELSTGDWRADVMAFARATMASMLRYPGIAQYIGRHNRFRMFQKVDPGEVDYGLEFFNQFACVLMQGGLSRKAVATGYHLLMRFLVASANSEIGRMEPAPGAARAGGHYPSPNRSLKRSAASALPLGLDAVPRGYSSAMRSSQ